MSLAEAIRHIRQRLWSDRELGELARDADDAITVIQTRLNRLEWRSGHSVVDFGAHPGAAEVYAKIHGQRGISQSSVVQAWIAPGQTADHSPDEHSVEAIDVRAQDAVNDVGFTVRVFSTDGSPLYGEWRIGWRWN